MRPSPPPPPRSVLRIPPPPHPRPLATSLPRLRLPTASPLLPAPLLLAAFLLVLSACATPATTPWQTEDQLQAVDGQTWVVGGHLVTIAPETTPSAKPVVGATVRLSGQRTARGELLADAVEVVTPTPTPRSAPTSVQARPTPPPTQPRATPTPQRKPPKRNTNHQDDEADD